MKHLVFSRFARMMMVVGLLLVLAVAFALSNKGPATHAQPSYNYVGVLPSGASLGKDGTVASPNHAYVLTLQGDGDLILTLNGGFVWSSLSTGSGGTSVNASMQTDGNFVVYCHGGTGGCGTARSIFSTCTYRDSYSHLEVQNDGNVVVYTPNHKAVWARTWNRNCH